MPSKPLHKCNKPGCNQLTADRFCKDHQTEYRQTNDKLRGSYRERGYSSRWDKVRKFKVSQDPLCQMCEAKGFLKPVEIVHHIQTVRERPDLVHDLNNLMSVCRSCHGELHAADHK